MALDSVTELPADLAARIERLHRQAEPDLITALVGIVARIAGCLRGQPAQQPAL
jgi:hypothetical protein